MARTRQTARSSGVVRHETHFTDDQYQTELFCKLVRENCFLLKSSLSPEININHPMTKQKLEQYKHCTKLAQLWILEDMMKNEREQQTNNQMMALDEHLLRRLPEELKVEIVAFIPTTSTIPCITGMKSGSYMSGGDLSGVPLVEHIDVWFISWMKYRTFSKSFKIAMETMIFKVLSMKGLDITGFILRGLGCPDKRILFLSALLKAHDRFMKGNWDGSFELKSLVENESFFEKTIVGVNSEQSLNTSTLFEVKSCDQLDVKSINFDNIRTIEEDFLKTKEFNEQTPFDNGLQPKVIERDIDLVDKQSVKLLQTFNQFNFMDQVEIPTKKTFGGFSNYWIKTLAFTLEKNCLLDGIFDILPKIEDLIIIIYNSYGIQYSLQSLNLNERTNLKSLKIICLDNPHWTEIAELVPSAITTFHTFLQDGPLIGGDQMDIILDGKKVQSVDYDYETYPPLQNSTLHIQSSNFDFFKKVAHKYYLFPNVSLENFLHRVCKFEKLEEQRLFTDFITKNYPFEEFSLSFTTLRRNDLKELSWNQYLIYIANTYHCGKTSICSIREVPILLYYGLDITNNILKIHFPNAKIASLLLEHLRFLMEKNLYSIDIASLKRCFFHHVKSYTKEQAMKVLLFACENLKEDQRLEFFEALKIGKCEFNLVHLATKLDDYFFNSIIKYFPHRALLGKTTSNREDRKVYFHLLHVAIDSELSNDTILKLIEREPLIVTQVDSQNLTPLHWVCYKSSRWPLVPHLEKIAGPDCWSKLDSEGRTPFHYAEITAKSFIHLFPFRTCNDL